MFHPGVPYIFVQSVFLYLTFLGSCTGDGCSIPSVYIPGTWCAAVAGTAVSTRTRASYTYIWYVRVARFGRAFAFGPYESQQLYGCGVWVWVMCFRWWWSKIRKLNKMMTTKNRIIFPTLLFEFAHDRDIDRHRACLSTRRSVRLSSESTQHYIPFSLPLRSS